jgi:hypothetical protein
VIVALLFGLPVVRVVGHAGLPPPLIDHDRLIMRDDVAIAIAVFVMFVLIIAALAYFGYDRWGDVPREDDLAYGLEMWNSSIVIVISRWVSSGCLRVYRKRVSPSFLG